MSELKAFAVLEGYEDTGGIIFARSAVEARRLGANEYADGEFGNVSCRRAQWADKFADTRMVPVSEMIWAGWHFECSGCGVRIEESLPDYHDDGSYEGWTPNEVIGHQHSIAFCRQSCSDAYDQEQAARKRVCDRAIERFRRIILRRFPEAQFVDRDGYRCKPHAWANRRHPDRHWRVEQVCVPFDFPDAQYGPASLDYHPSSSWPSDRKPRYTCAGGDKGAFEAYARRTAGARP